MARVLLIEPDKILASNVISALQRKKHAIDWQVDPQAALDDADNKLPDVIILDLVLANRGGVEFLYEFRSYPDWQKVPVIVFSSLSAEELRGILTGLEHLSIVALHYKPNTRLSELVKTVDTALKTVKV